MRLQPKTPSDVLSDASMLLGRAWRSLFPIGLLAFIPAGAFTLFIFRSLGADEVLAAILDPERLRTLSPDTVMSIAGPLFQASAAALGIQLIVSVFVLIASHLIISSHVALDPIGPGMALRRAARKTVSGVVAVFVAGVPVLAAFTIGFSIWLFPAATATSSSPATSFVGLLLLVIFLVPGMWLLASVSMTTAAVAIENRGIMESVTRSFRLVRGRRAATLGFLLLVGLLGWIAAQLIQLIAIPMALVGTGNLAVLLTSILGIAFQGIIVAAIGVPLTVWYFDLRARHEQLTTDQLK